MVTGHGTYKPVGNNDRNSVIGRHTSDTQRFLFTQRSFFVFLTSRNWLFGFYLPLANASQKRTSQILSTLKISMTNIICMKKTYRQLPILTCFTIISVFFLSCNGTKQAAKTNNENIMQTETFQPSYNISAKTKMFLSELENEISQVKNIENFKPSNKLIASYNIRKQGNDYFISGFIKPNDQFDRNNLEPNNVTFGQAIGIVVTVQVPLRYLSQFLKAKGIEYFEISEKVNSQ